MAASQPEGADPRLKLAGFHSLLFHLHCLLSLLPTASFRPLPLASSGFLPVCFYQISIRIWWHHTAQRTSLRRWMWMAMPGWQATRGAPLMVTATLEKATSSLWNLMAKVSTNGLTNAVVRAGMRLVPSRRMECDVLRFRFVSMEENCRTLYGVHVRHHHLSSIAQSVRMPLQGQNPG